MTPSPPKDYLTENLKLLSRFHPRIRHYITPYLDRSPGKVRHFPDGKVDIVVQDGNGHDIHLYLPHEGERRLAHYLDVVPEDFFGFVGFLGMGTGQEMSALMRMRPHVDLSDFLSDFRLILSVGPDVQVNDILMPAVDTLMLETIHVFNHPGAFSLDITSKGIL